MECCMYVYEIVCILYNRFLCEANVYLLPCFACHYVYFACTNEGEGPGSYMSC